MIKQFFTQPKVLSRLQEGVFGPYLPVFAASLHEEGYSRGCIRRHLRAADHFGVWLTGRRLTVGDLTRATLDRYIEGGGRLYSASTPNGRLPHSAQGLHELLEFLESQGVIAPAVETPLTSAGKWLAEFDSHLDRTLGCAPRSRSNYLLYARRFLEECFGHAEIEWQKLSADAIVDFVRREAAKLQPISCGQPVTAMRAFLRFLTSTGVIPAGLTGAVPSVRTWRHSVLPRAVSADQAQSRNVRLAAVHSFFRMVAIRDPASVGVATRVLAIPVKRTDKRLLGYLTRKEMDARHYVPLLPRPLVSVDSFGSVLLTTRSAIGAGHGFDGWLFPGEPRHRRQLRWVEGIGPTPTAMDVDVVIGRLGPIAPPEICNGLIVPSWFLIKFTPSTAIRSFKAIPKSEQVSAEAFAPASEELFDKITQMADKAGSTGEHRALNYLAVRYPPSVRNTIRL